MKNHLQSFITCFIIAVLIFSFSFARTQSVDSTLIENASKKISHSSEKTTPENRNLSFRSLAIPTLMIAYGFTALKSEALTDFNKDVKREIWTDHPHAKIHADNYLQFAPAAAVYGLNIAGVKGKNNFKDRTIMYLISNILLNATVSITKHSTQQLRPDGSSYESFPSGHTTEAFASAEFLRQEYKESSPWYGIAGYTIATTTGVLRMYNNKHWFSDVVAGAGIGMVSTKLAYWLYPKIKRKFSRNKKTATEFH